MKLADHDAHSTASVSTLEPVGYQKASTASGTKRKRQSDTDLEDLELLQKKALYLIAINYLNTTPPQSREEHNEFKEYLQEMKVHITDVSVGSLVITVKCESLKSLEELWEDYSCGLLDKMVQDCFVTEKILKELNLAELKLKTTMDIEEYNACKLYFLEKDALRDALSSEFHSISSTSESPHKQEELKKWKQKTKIVETEKMKGTSPLTVKPTTGHVKELIEKGQGRKGMLPLLGSSTSDSEESEVESFTYDSEEEPEEIRMKLQIMKGASSSEFHSISSTSESPQKQEELKKWKQKTKIAETEKLKGSSPPLLLPTTDFEENLGRICVDLKMLRVEGGFPVLQFSTVDLEKKLAKVRIEHQRHRFKGTLHLLELFTADLEDEIKGLRNELFRLKMKGSSHPLVSTIEVELDGLLKQLSKWRKEVELEEQLKKLQKTRMEGSFPVLLFSTIDLEEKLEELCMESQRLRMKGTLLAPVPLTADLEEKLKGLLTELERQRDKGSLPHTSYTIEVELEELLKKLQKTRMEVMLPLPGSSIFDLEEKLRKLHMDLEMMEGSLHSLPATDLVKKLEQFKGIRMLRMRGSFSVLDLEKKLAELRMELQRLRIEGTLPPPELFTADLEDELQQLEQLIWILIRRKRVKGSLRSLFLTIERVSSLRRELEKVKMAASKNAMYSTIRSGLAKFDVSVPEELQNYVSYLLNESAKLHFRKQVLQPPRALEELREAMDKDELISFLTIHIREGAWQVVLLFTDELPRVKLPRDWCGIIHNEDEDEDEDEEVSNEVIYSSTSGILNGWQTKYDPDLITLCKAITNRDWKVTRLILSRSQISDEGLKNLSTALPQSELYSLTLCGIGVQIQGLKYLCEALISSDCHLTTLNVSLNWWRDEEMVYLCKALTSIDCTLTSLNVSNNMLRDEGIKLLGNALTSVNCRLTSLNVSGNTFGDEGIKHLCKALTDTNCKLRSLDYHGNRNVTDKGRKYLSQMLTGTDWEVRGAQLSRSTTK